MPILKLNYINVYLFQNAYLIYLLDIFQFLWENIVLEIPLQFTKVKDLSKFHGDGWKLVSEDELTTRNNPFSDLLKDFEEE